MISVEDRLQIYELISLHGHLVDSGQLDNLNQVFAEDAAFDLTAFDMGIHHGLTTVRDASLALGDKNPVGHHVTNIVITEVEQDDTVHVRSKGIGIYTNATPDSAVYTDVIKRHGNGWRIVARKIAVRRKPLVED
jgi:3-phenylpropionate/cinnamic acid dioxygenase small subunit